MTHVFEAKKVRWKDHGETETGTRLYEAVDDEGRHLSPGVGVVIRASGRSYLSAGLRPMSFYNFEDKEAVFADPEFWVRLMAAGSRQRSTRERDEAHPTKAWYIDHLNPRFLHIHTGIRETRYDLLIHFDRKDWVAFRKAGRSIVVVARGMGDDWHELYLKPEQIRDMEKMAAQL